MLCECCRTILTGRQGWMTVVPASISSFSTPTTTDWWCL